MGSNVDKRLRTLEADHMQSSSAQQIRMIDQYAADWTQAEEDRAIVEAAQYPPDGQIRLVIVERPDER